MKNQMPQWRFRAMQPGEMNVDPIEGEFFTTEALRSVTDALVRESIQNSLDASAGSDPVTVRFSHHQNPIAGVDSSEGEIGDAPVFMCYTEKKKMIPIKHAT
jgi:hypothetical protein